MKPETLHTLQMYVAQGIPTGGFLQAVLSNDLKLAVKLADEENLRDLVEITTYVIWMMPAECQGSPEKVVAWVKSFEARR
jgi:hypothetical protein